MAIITCENCGKHYSDQAETCPFCTEKIEPDKKRTLMFAISILMACLVGSSATWLLMREQHTEKAIKEPSKSIVKTISQEPATQIITGAFGKQLGEIFDISDATGTSFDPEEMPIYQFIPQDPLPIFKGYSLQITPKTHLIYRIQAETKIGTRQSCINQAKVLLSMINEKYGPTTKIDESYYYSTEAYFSHGGRRIIVECSDFFGDELSLTYQDNQLGGQAKAEWIDLEKQQVDSSGI